MTLQRIHAALLESGFALISERDLGLNGREVAQAFSPSLVPDPRGAGKRHARDVITWDGEALAEKDSIAFTAASGQVVDDFSRFHLLAVPGVAKAMLSLIPGRGHRGEMSADYFRYAPGVGIGGHRDGFGKYVVIWCLRRSGAGAESFLTAGGATVLHHALASGEILVFLDGMFEHGMTVLTGDGANRDALIFITLKDRA